MNFKELYLLSNICVSNCLENELEEINIEISKINGREASIIQLTNNYNINDKFNIFFNSYKDEDLIFNQKILKILREGEDDWSFDHYYSDLYGEKPLSILDKNIITEKFSKILNDWNKIKDKEDYQIKTYNSYLLEIDNFSIMDINSVIDKLNIVFKDRTFFFIIV